MKDNKLPIRTEIEILPADEPKQFKLGWTVKEYLGSSCFLVSDPTETIIDTLDGLRVGDEIVVWRTWIVTVEKVEGRKAMARTGRLSVPMEFDIDDRHCWVATAMINLKAVEKLTMNVK